MTLKDALEGPHIIVSSRQEPTCGRDDCTPSEQPEHWVDVELTPVAKACIAVLPELEKRLIEIRDIPANQNSEPDAMAEALERINTMARVALVAIANVKEPEVAADEEDLRRHGVEHHERN